MIDRRQVTCLVESLNMETYHGHVRTPADAIILFEACRIGLLPRVQRRLSEKERQSIKSGSIFVWDEREAGMRRWTDGKSWSASRVSGSFLTYREMEGKRGGNGMSAPLFSGNNAKKELAKEQQQDMQEDGPDGYRYKPDGLMKQSFSITTSTGQHLHLISYYSRTAQGAQNLNQPSNDPQLRHIRPEKGMYPESTVQDQNNIPAVTRGPMTSPGFAASPQQAPNMASTPYGRPPPSGPPYAGYQQGWAPPSPMHTPPQSYSPHYQNGYQHAPAPATGPAPIGQSPLQHMHYPSYSHAYSQQAPSATPFDRAPAPLSNNGLPPPQPTQHHPLQNGYGYSASAPSYPQPPRQEQQHHQTQHIPSLNNAPQIDPQLSGILPRHDSVNPKYDENTQKNHAASPRPLVATSSAQTIPSISSLINNAQAASEEQNRARTTSRSPPGGQQRQTQDIPLHKLGFHQPDVRALRDLDKATFRV